MGELEMLLGQAELSPEEIELFRKPLDTTTQNRIISKYFTPYGQRVGMGEAQPVGALGGPTGLSLKNYIQEVLSRLPQ